MSPHEKLIINFKQQSNNNGFSVVGVNAVNVKILCLKNSILYKTELVIHY